MAYTIKKGLPSDLNNTRATKYGFENMKHGTYIDIPANDSNGKRRNRGGGCAAGSAAASYSRRHNKKFVTRRLASGTFRIWCVNPGYKG